MHCSLALEAVREVYERQRQPEVLREASEYFAKLTGGRYTRAWTSLGHRVLWVDDAEGKPLAVDKLSRGTREQLFLSLRLALVSAYARRGVRLPIVMDDVLVNFDVGRVKAAVDVLRDFVRRRPSDFGLHLPRAHRPVVSRRQSRGANAPWQPAASARRRPNRWSSQHRGLCRPRIFCPRFRNRPTTTI